MPTPLSPAESNVGFAALRRYIDGTGYGYYFSDANVRVASDAVVNAVEQYRAAVPAAKRQQGPLTTPDGHVIGAPTEHPSPPPLPPVKPPRPQDQAPSYFDDKDLNPNAKPPA